MKAYPMCFGCGSDNPHGLHLTPRQADDGAWQSEFTPKTCHCGWPGVVHGGVLATALDEISGYVVFGEGLAAVITNMNITYQKPAAPGETLLVRARPTNVTRRIVDTSGEILRADGTVIASCRARFLVLNEAQLKEIGILEP